MEDVKRESKGRLTVVGRGSSAYVGRDLFTTTASRPKLVMARPTGVGRALATYEIPIEGRDEWLAAARRLA